MHTRTALIALLGIDALLIAIFLGLHVADVRGAIETVPDLFKINARDGVPTLLLFLKWLLMSWVMARAARRTGARWAWGLALMFFLLWFDDWAEVHEFFGDRMVEVFGLQPIAGLDADDIGEAVYILPFAALCFGLVIWAMRAAGPGQRRDLVVLFVLLVVLGGFGVGVDLIAQAVRPLASDATFDPRFVFLTIEDSGELVVGSLMLVRAARIAHRLTAAARSEPAGMGLGKPADPD
ncbi:hypothetical protein DLJ49_11805 [Rhodovulum sp. 12E13]|uniref:hypothetical protein n=1 Tax=Rhodovulum sp. 12E13 TaxID=2203891 RepID=UPI000E1A2773|nr:hypothetical protein [Rhodovulum sp. 12E13]RDC72045.1 hypothetical protein DLJ49_11805 [Rhodovulum sp. 12E13]